MNSLAVELNNTIESANNAVKEMLSGMGSELFFPKGILSQSAEAKKKAHKLNATIGIATEKDSIMCFPSVMSSIHGISPETSLTYAPSFGIPGLRTKWQEEIFAKNPSLKGKKISLPVVASGITHAISVFADMWIDPGDVVIIPDKMWGNYNLMLDVRKGARLSKYPLFNDDGGFNIEAFESLVRKEAADNDKIAVLLNFPNNPTGYTISRREGEEIAGILTDVADGGVNVVVACDDAYFGLFYEEETLKESVFSLLCDRHPRLLAVKLDGATKENFVWGLRVAFITYGCRTEGDPSDFFEALEKKTAGCIRGNVSNASHLGQSIVLKSMQSPEYAAEKEEKFHSLKARALEVRKVLANERYSAAWDVYPFNSGYFMCVELKTVDAETLRVHLLDNYGVGLIAIGDKDLRVAFSCLEVEEIEPLFDMVLAGVKDLS